MRAPTAAPSARVETKTIRNDRNRMPRDLPQGKASACLSCRVLKMSMHRVRCSSKCCGPFPYKKIRSAHRSAADLSHTRRSEVLLIEVPRTFPIQDPQHILKNIIHPSASHAGLAKRHDTQIHFSNAHPPLPKHHHFSNRNIVGASFLQKVLERGTDMLLARSRQRPTGRCPPQFRLPRECSPP